jgi:hypothetical protein
MKKTKQKKSRTKSNPAFLAQTLFLSPQKHGSLISFTPAAPLVTGIFAENNLTLLVFKLLSIDQTVSRKQSFNTFEP